MDKRRCSTLYLLALLCVSNLTVALTAWESIHQTIHTYPLAIDSKDFTLLSQVLTLQSLASKPLNRALAFWLVAQKYLSICWPISRQVFSPDAFANYTGDLSDLRGLPAIETGLAASVAKVYSQHLLGTTVIDIHNGKCSANSTTYFQATLFGNPYSIGSVVSLYGYYADTLDISIEGWRISKRQLVFQGPGFVGNLSLVGMWAWLMLRDLSDWQGGLL